MNRRRLYQLSLLLLLIIGVCRPSSADQTPTDVLVYGATPGGIAAAVSVAKAGRSVTLVEPTDRIGGLLTSGLSYTDFRSFESLTGFFLDFANRVEAHYVTKYGPDSPQVEASFRGTHGEPSVNLLVLKEMLAEHSTILVVKQLSLESVKTSGLIGGRQTILSASFKNDAGAVSEIHAKMLIDSSYEGDLMALAGESYHVGRESSAQYGEQEAGDEFGQADGQVQGYNYRLIMTDLESNKLMPVAPKGYNRKDFAGVLQHFESGKLTKVFSEGHDGIYRAHVPFLPHGKTDVNDTPHAPVRLSMPDINDSYPDADAETRSKIVSDHRYYNVGLLYFLQNDDEVPDAIRKDARRFGWCKDEFKETGGVPPKLYIREARRMVGQYVFTGNDTVPSDDDARSVLHRDSIAIGDYVHNCHGTGRKGTRYDGSHVGEFYKNVPPYQIPYGVIVPQKTRNLLVPVACSASHFGFGAIRLEPIWCSLGQAAGWAASQSIEMDRSVQDVDVEQLQKRLHADGSATIYVSDVPPNTPDFAAVQWWGTRGGLHGLAPNGQPKSKHIIGQYNEAFPGHAAELDEPLSADLFTKWGQQVANPSTPPKDSASRRWWVQSVFQSEN